MLIKEASIKWNISERRIRKLIEEGRIEGATKISNIWNIPDDVAKPIDRRVKREKKVIPQIDEACFNEVDNKLIELFRNRKINANTMNNLKEIIDLELIYNSNGLKGNTLSLQETQIVLNGTTVGGKTINEHLETINHRKAISFMDKLVVEENPITEAHIKELNHLMLDGIDSQSGTYRTDKENQVPEQMEKMIYNYVDLKQYHPIIKAAYLHSEISRIKPFKDGNERCARLLMNLSLMNSGFAPIVIKKENKFDYYKAVVKATNNNYEEFIKLIIKEESTMLDRYLKIVK